MPKASKRKPMPVARVIELLEPLYGPATIPRGWDALSELIYTVLSQNTSDRNSYRAYDSLRRVFPTWQAVAQAPDDAIASAIQVGGLAKVKAPRIKAILRTIQ